ncbi:3-deoxy-7-phosphoheptulonate synthase [Candidatus Protochlamydia phocaeensis]|uniref:3-deoxy-7-phosphoheptulonate synthase n=1 Tax=Candidatus Protochlamydia phocaeensis TaxID=1414722 RepID=UPI00083810F7|nr:3-deoxy-7-phosphoheptulonate synthase [Candidatus Protochlamydia phocaeensis]
MERLPSYKELKNRLPLTLQQKTFVTQSRQTIRDILNRKDPRLLLIVGPCSIHDTRSAKDFARQLKELAANVASQFFLVMRVYFEKPRTSAGWKGFLYDPLLDGSNRMQQGIELSRQLLLELADLEVPTATEFLDPLTAFYYNDLIAWGSIGARTSSSQTHRQFASGLDMPIGFKNGIAGNISAAVHGVIAASHSHSYMGLNEEGFPVVIHTPGNSDAHIVLRGGEHRPNYDPASISEAASRLSHAQLPVRLIVDCSHQNSGKKYDRQPGVFQSVLHQIAEGNPAIRGLMLESHLYAGSQLLPSHPSQLSYGVSITDSCLDWNSTQHLIRWGAHHLNALALASTKAHLDAPEPILT